jgi:adenine-specific DNA-methyltransferase
MITPEYNRIEARRQAIQTDIEARRSSADRNRLGQFATPNPLAVEITSYVATLLGPTTRDIRFADPSIGTGSFFSAALTVFGRERIATAIGVELDPAFCDAASDLWTDAGLQIACGDFTRIVADDSRPPAPNLILANPPYVRHHHLDREDKERLRTLTFQMTSVDVNGLAGLYVYFVLLATAWMEEDGYAAWLIPSEFMDVNYGSALKRFLTDRVTLIRVHRFAADDVQFGNALVSSVVLVFRKAIPRHGHTAEFTFGGTLALPYAGETITLDRLRDSRKWTMYPQHVKNDRRASTNGDGPTLEDFFRIQRGIATGSNEFFVLERSDAIRRGLPKKYLRPILPSPRHLKATIIDADQDGYPLIDPQLCVIDCDVPEHVVEAKYPALWAYLQTGATHGIQDRYLVSKRSPWYKQEQRQPAPFLCTYMGRGGDEKQPFRFIWNRSAATATNLYLMLYPRADLAGLLSAQPECGALIHDLLRCVSGHELRGEGRVYGGGLNKIEPRELGRISAALFVEQWPQLKRAVQRQGTLFR